MDPVISAILIVSALCVIAWIVDTIRLRAAARRIDLSYQKLQREPQWTPMDDPLEFGDALKAKFDTWDELCGRFGFRPLTRLRESYDDGTVLGARTVLLNQEQTVIATLASSHKDPRVAFRSFVASVGEKIVAVSDARAISMRPANHVFKLVAKETTESSMLSDLKTELEKLAVTPDRYESVASYVRLQQRMWREANALRTNQGYVVQLEMLRRLAPANLSEARLRRIHRYIERRHAKI